MPANRLISQPAVISAVLLYDFLAIVGAGVVTYDAWHSGEKNDLRFLAFTSLGVWLGALSLLGARWAYTIRALSSAPRQAVDLAFALLLSMAGLVVCSALLDFYTPTERNWLSYWFLTAWALACLRASPWQGRLRIGPARAVWRAGR